MTKEEFRTLFAQALEVAAQNADKKLGYPVPRRFGIQMHGLASRPRMLTQEEAFEEIYIGAERFYRIIDIAVRSVTKDVTNVFMGISGHEPGPLSQTWNQPAGSGPFKQVLACHVEVIADPVTDATWEGGQNGEV